jgi:hypothetical protein
MGERTMKKNKPARLYPKKEDITIENFIIENKQLVILLFIMITVILFIIGCILCIDMFKAEHFYNYL